MKLRSIKYFLILLIPALFLSCDFDEGDDSAAGANIDLEVYACFAEVNKFRTGSEAWYWNQDDTTKTNLVGKLGELVLDEELCRAAQIRANEIVNNFSHTRPNGTSCGTVLTDCSIKYSARGENICAGTVSSTGKAAFIQWKEDGQSYSGQGHRRNMLGNFTKIGIAHAYDPNSRYKNYWAMILIK